MENRQRWPILILFTASFFGIASMTFFPVFAGDFWVYLKVSQIAHQMHNMPSTILFSIDAVANRPYIAHSWLANWFYYGITLPAKTWWYMALLRFALFSCLWLLVYRCTYHHWQDKAQSMALALITVLAVLFRFYLRPELLAVIVCCWQVYTLSRLMEKPSWPWVWSAWITQCLWANVHGSFLLGLALPPLVAMLVWEKSWMDPGFSHRRFVSFWASLVMGCALASLINPHGFALWQHCWWLTHADYIHRYIKEWYSPFVIDIFSLWRFVLLSVYLFLIYHYRRAFGFGLWVWSAIFLCMVLQSYRHIDFFAILMLLPFWQSNLLWQKEKQNRWIVSLLVLVFVCLWASPITKRLDALAHQDSGTKLHRLSLSAQRFIEANIQGNVYNTALLGGELLYRFYPKIRVSMDGRVDAYGSAYFQLHRKLLLASAPEVQAFLTKHSIQAIILLPKDAEIWATLPSYQGVVAKGPWRKVFADQGIVVFMQDHSQIRQRSSG